MMSLPFEKYEGTENDFIFVTGDSLSKNFDGPELAKSLCSRKKSVGADGLVIVHDFSATGDTSHFRWDFYNNDGSHADMCGNAARCAVSYSFHRSQSSHCNFETKIGIVIGSYGEGLPTVELPLATPEVQLVTLSVSEKDVSGYFVNSGVPHFVILQETYSPFNNALALAIQQHTQFAPDATNVTFLEAEGSRRKTISFERGVEDYTKACGTGAIACGLVLQKVQGEIKVALQAPGGPLEVEISPKSVSLTGPARRLCNGNAFLY